MHLARAQPSGSLGPGAGPCASSGGRGKAASSYYHLGSAFHYAVTTLMDRESCSMRRRISRSTEAPK
ncbi:hypothetical protein Y1Q_0010051 [Alligator mississippiensis]|uniref:Uncharacterized protein n=1 Tax=Alligator mississippiensis TaxID=8496 RepID=A0A151P4B8_ALLMI|nr:hypothetical protein Y1Q_0010051 [Alligator mississippiensis]